MNPWQYKLNLFDLSYGISHGFDITLDLLLMARNFKDILRFVFFRIVYVIHIAYNISTLRIMWHWLN